MMMLTHKTTQQTGPGPNSGKTYTVITQQILWACTQKSFTVADMADYFHVHPSTIRKAVKHLERCGVIRKTQPARKSTPLVSAKYSPSWTILPTLQPIQPQPVSLPPTPEDRAVDRLLSLVEPRQIEESEERHPLKQGLKPTKPTEGRCKHGMIWGSCSICNRLYGNPAALQRKVA